MQRRMTATIAIGLVLVVAGCGKDDTSNTSATSTATLAQPSAAASAGNEVGTPTGGARGSKSKSKASKTSSGSKSSKSSAAKGSASKKSSTAKRSSGSKASGTKTPAASAEGSPSTADSTSSGGAASDPRLAVVAVIRRYQKDFVEGDGKDACTLLTVAGKKQMISGGRGQTCPASVKRVLDQSRPADIRLIERTRAGIHVDDVKIRGDSATVDIGKGQRLRLERQGGQWLVSDPSP
jgi:hypothetical protein